MLKTKPTISGVSIQNFMCFFLIIVTVYYCTKLLNSGPIPFDKSAILGERQNEDFFKYYPNHSFNFNGS
jgi:hypothetical protein